MAIPDCFNCRKLDCCGVFENIKELNKKYNFGITHTKLWCGIAKLCKWYEVKR